MAKKTKNKLKNYSYEIYIVLLVFSIFLLIVPLILNISGYIESRTMFITIRIALVLLILSIFAKSKI